jgi:tetratricopeptide (TPR) repeat protein
MGNLLRKAKRWEEANEMFYKAIAINPNLPQLYNNLGNVFLDTVSLSLIFSYNMIKPSIVIFEHLNSVQISRLLVVTLELVINFKEELMKPLIKIR